MDAIDADSLTFSIKDVLLQTALPVSNCSGLCYDGASNMSGAKNGVAKQLAYIKKLTL